jgi:propionyl-CoA carboxylase alpha chain
MGSKLVCKGKQQKNMVFHWYLEPRNRSAIWRKPKKLPFKSDFPFIVKASAGGGGKGMRIVGNENEFDEQVQRAMSEALAAFGDGSVFIEKYVTSPRHIEIQILGDQQGNMVYLLNGNVRSREDIKS